MVYIHFIREIKAGGSPSAKAKTLVLIGDNYSENKSNVTLDFACELVMQGASIALCSFVQHSTGWFDEVQLLFGPVGHTHNGVDAVHKVGLHSHHPR